MVDEASTSFTRKIASPSALSYLVRPELRPMLTHASQTEYRIRKVNSTKITIPAGTVPVLHSLGCLCHSLGLSNTLL